MSESTISKKISVVFVLEDDIDKANVSNDMKAAHQCCTDQEVSTAWLPCSECLKLNPRKTDIFVLEEFSGKAFNFLKDFKCVIIAPRCLMTCLLERKPIPNIPSPIFTIAMVGIVVTSTGFTKERKQILSEKVGLMGGIYLNAFNASVTHLVAEAVGSQKYKVAVERNVPIMSEGWIEAVWAAGLKQNVSALDPEFSHHKLAAFKGMLICASQISKKDKQNLMKLITSNGGQYSPQLDSKETGLLVIGEPSGTKFTYAKKWGIPCVKPQWVFDSSSKGCCLPFDSYAVEGDSAIKALCSTPENGRSQGPLPDFSMCSTIAGDSSHMNINETINVEFSAAPEPKTPRKGRGGNQDYIELVNKLDVSEAKKAGSFLDGCKVYLSGFSPSQVEKLRKIINGGGATRFHQITESVSHVIVGEFMYEEIKALKSGKFRPFVVRVDWLLESIRLGRVADEEKFQCFDLKPLEPPSPLSKKGLQLLQGGPSNANSETTGKSSRVDSRGSEEAAEPTAEANERELVQKYLGGNSPDMSTSKPVAVNQESSAASVRQENSTSRNEVSHEEQSQENSNSMDERKLFHGLKFVVAGFDRDPDEEDVAEEIQQMLTDFGGQVMLRRFRGIPDYGIVPIEGGQLPCTVDEVVTHLWLEDCHEQSKVVPVEYYHRPFVVESNCKPLFGCVIGISSYVGKERLYITSLAEALGAFSQEVFSKKDIPEKGAIASTHLICPTPEGNKYAAAVKWGLPAVTKEWILACAQKGQKVPESDYYVAQQKAGSKTPGQSVEVPIEVPKVSVLEKRATPSKSESFRSNSNVADDKSEKCVTSISEGARAVGSLQSRQSTGTPLTTTRTSAVSAIRGGDSSRDCENPVCPKMDDQSTAKAFDRGVFTPPNCQSHDFKTPDVATEVSGVNDEAMEVGVGANELDADKEEADKGGGQGKSQRLRSTPGTPYGQVFEANPSGSTRKAWKNWVETIPRLHQPTPPRMEKKPETPLSELKRRLWASIDSACKKIEMRLDSEGVSSEGGSGQEAVGKRKRPEDPEKSCKRGTKPFTGVVAYIWKEFPQAEREQLATKVKDLGGTTENSYSETVTHAIFQGESCETSEEYRHALEVGKVVVAPAWVELCASEGMRKDEALFPPTDYPMRYSGETPVNWECLKSKSQAIGMAPTQLVNLKPDVAWECLHGGNSNQSNGSIASFRKPEVHMQLKKLDSVLAEEVQLTPEKVRISRAASSTASWEDRVHPFPDAAIGGQSAHHSPRTTSAGYYLMANPPSPSTQGSASEVITWQENGTVDEAKSATRDKIKRKISKLQEEETKRQPRFMFSSMEEADRMKYRGVVESLGGQMCSDTNFDSGASHLITFRPARSEKLLGSIASGIWVLHPKYLEESMLKGKFLEEDPYEWGNPDGFIPVPSMEIERILSESIHRWRVRIRGSPGPDTADSTSSTRPMGAFEGVCAIVHLVEERAAAFRRLIVAGAGTISIAKISSAGVQSNLTRPPYSSASDATLCLMEIGRCPGTPVDLESLARKGIHCLKPIYLNECLMRVDAPDPLEFAIPEYLATLSSLQK